VTSGLNGPEIDFGIKNGDAALISSINRNGKSTPFHKFGGLSKDGFRVVLLGSIYRNLNVTE